MPRVCDDQSDNDVDGRTDCEDPIVLNILGVSGRYRAEPVGAACNANGASTGINDYSGPGITNPHPLARCGDWCTTCHGGDGEALGKAESHVPPHPRVNRQYQANNPEAANHRITLQGSINLNSPNIPVRHVRAVTVRISITYSSSTQVTCASSLKAVVVAQAVATLVSTESGSLAVTSRRQMASSQAHAS